MIKWISESLRIESYLYDLKVFPYMYLLITKGKISVQWRNVAENHLNQEIQISITNNGKNWPNTPRDIIAEKTTTSFL